MEKLVHNVETGQIVVTELTPEEIEENIKLQQEHQKELELKAQAEAKREAALSKLAALGLTADDLKALGL